MKLKIIILILFFFNSVCFSQTENSSIVIQKNIDDTIKVSVAELILKPNNYHKKRIEVTGFISLDFEGTAIYNSEEDFSQRLYKKSIWLSLHKEDAFALKKLYNETVTKVVGVFNMNSGGHMDLFSGIINVEIIGNKVFK